MDKSRNVLSGKGQEGLRGKRKEKRKEIYVRLGLTLDYIKHTIPLFLEREKDGKKKRKKKGTGSSNKKKEQ